LIINIKAEKINSALAENIQKIHSNIPGLQKITELDPIFAGGYSMALLFAPREPGNVTKIKTDYYSDFDVYFESESNALEAISVLSEFSSQEIYRTKNAATIMVDKLDNAENPTAFQIISKIQGKATDILESFDFVNCAVAYTPKRKSFYLHKDAPKFHRERVLQILKPWMLEQCLSTEASTSTDALEQNIVVQLARFKKYANRWEYALSDESFKKLISVYEKFPNIVTKSNIAYQTTGGPYSGASYLAYRNQNIWKAMSDLFISHELWASYKDKAGVIQKTTPQDVPEGDILHENVPF